MTLKHLRSSTLDKRPQPSGMADGQLAINTASGSPGLFFKDADGSLVKVGPVHVGSGAPNSTVASGGASGNTVGEQWLDTSGGTYVFKVWDGAAWRSEAGEFVNVSGDTMTGPLVLGPSSSLIFEGSTDDGFETTLTVVDPTADRTITLPNISGTVVTTGDTGSVTSTMILDGTIVNGDVNASAAIAGTKISPDFGSQNIVTTGNATAAALIPSGSGVPTNGVYLPSANNVAISTNGTGKLFVNSAGDIGIGASPSCSYKLEVKGGATDSVAIFDSTNAVGPHLRFSTSGTDRHYLGSAPGFTAGGTSSDFAIRTAGYLALLTGGNNERLRITSDGKLGLGTSSPSSLLDINGGYPTVTNNSDDYRLRWRRTDGSFVGGLSLDGFHKLTFKLPDTSGTTQDRLVIDSSGRVGIGTTSPSTAIDCVGTLRLRNNSSSAVQFYTEAGGAEGQIFYDQANNNLEITNFNSGFISFKTNDAERGRWDSSGRLLVGTSSSRSGWFNSSSWGNPTLQVEGTSVFNSGISVTNNSNDDNGSQIFLGKSRATSVGGVTVVSSGDNLGRISFQGADGSELIAAATIECNVDATPGANDMPGRLVFSTTADGASSPTERMRILNNGTTDLRATTDVFNVLSNAAAGTTNLLIRGGNSATSFTAYNIPFGVYTNGNVVNTNNSYAGISDLKLKANVVDANSQWNDLKALQVRNYNFKETTGQQTHTQIGLIAQEVELISPGLVSESPDRDEDGNDLGTVTKSVNYSVLYMKAVKALQEAMERIETLEAKVAALEGV